MERFKFFIANILVWLTIGIVFCMGSIMYSMAALRYARFSGVYPTIQAEVTASVNEYYTGVREIEFEYAGSNSFDGSNPHIGYVMYTVHAEKHADGTPLNRGTYEHGGHFCLKTREGWVMMPEGFFPQYVGFWMKLVGASGS